MLPSLEEQLEQTLALPSFMRTSSHRVQQSPQSCYDDDDAFQSNCESNTSPSDTESLPIIGKGSSENSHAVSICGVDDQKDQDLDDHPCRLNTPPSSSPISTVSEGVGTAVQLVRKYKKKSKGTSTSRRRTANVLSYRKTCNKCSDKKLKCTGGNPDTNSACLTCVLKGFECVFSHRQRPGPKMKVSEHKLTSLFSSRLISMAEEQKGLPNNYPRLPPATDLLAKFSLPNEIHSVSSNYKYQDSSPVENDSNCYNNIMLCSNNNNNSRYIPVKISETKSKPYGGPIDVMDVHLEDDCYWDFSMKKRYMRPNDDSLFNLTSSMDCFNFKRMKIETDNVLDGKSMKSYGMNGARIEGASALISLHSGNSFLN